MVSLSNFAARAPPSWPAAITVGGDQPTVVLERLEGEMRRTVIIKDVAIGVDKNQHEGVTLLSFGLKLPLFTVLALLFVVALEAFVVAQKGLIAVQDVV